MINLFNNVTIWENFLTNEMNKQETFRDKNLIKKITFIIEDLKNGKQFDEINFLKTKAIYKVIKKYQHSKPREVYYFPEPYQTYLKFINFWLLHQPSIINGFSKVSLAYNPGGDKVKQTIKQVHKLISSNETIYYYKTDITNFFNSIPIKLLFEKLRSFLSEKLSEKSLLIPLLKLFSEVIDIDDSKNVCKIAGMPIAGFLANVYLNDLDHLLSNEKITYFRYADDILLLTPSLDDLNHAVNKILVPTITKDLQLELSTKKTFFGILTHEGDDSLTFLGLLISQKMGIDVSPSAEKKIKESMKRRAKWYSYKLDKGRFKHNKNVIRMYINGINEKLFTRDSEDGTCWLEWYGGHITTTTTLKRVETYYVDQLQYLNNGKRDYSLFKELGYRSLINEYYKLK